MFGKQGHSRILQTRYSQQYQLIMASAIVTILLGVNHQLSIPTGLVSGVRTATAHSNAKARLHAKQNIYLRAHGGGVSTHGKEMHWPTMGQSLNREPCH